jgi:integrase/recombinase XerD
MTDMNPVTFTKTITVTIFTRHDKSCSHKQDGEHYKQCRCPKWLRYWLNGKTHRQSAKTGIWKVAEERRRELEATLAGLPVSKPKKTPHITIAEAVELFLIDKQGIAAKVMKAYRRELERFLVFCNGHGFLYPHHIGPEHLIKFRASWESLYPSTLTRGKVLARFREFLRFLHNARWIERLPKLSPIKAEEPPTLPLTPEQYTKLLETIPSLFRQTKAIRTRALVQLMRYTGLSVRDAVTLERSALTHSGHWRVTTARQKTKTHVSVPIPQEIALELIEAHKLNQNPLYVFWNTGRGLPQTATTNWQDDLRVLFRAAGMPEGHPHQLRDTFAVHLLSSGIPLEEVSKALGHASIRVTEKHYAPWVKARQNRLDSLIAGTWEKQLTNLRPF